MNTPEEFPLVLSVRQPWAWAIVYGGKDVENRSVAVKSWGRRAVGQTILIHAGKAAPDEGYASLLKSYGVKRPPHISAFKLGGVIGSVDVLGIIEASDSVWWEGPCGFLLARPTPLPFRPLRGQLGLFRK